MDYCAYLGVWLPQWLWEQGLVVEVLQACSCFLFPVVWSWYQWFEFGLGELVSLFSTSQLHWLGNYFWLDHWGVNSHHENWPWKISVIENGKRRKHYLEKWSFAFTWRGSESEPPTVARWPHLRPRIFHGGESMAMYRPMDGSFIGALKNSTPPLVFFSSELVSKNKVLCTGGRCRRGIPAYFG